MLRSNYWLTIHVLTEVSSYGEFLLAAMLGLIATFFYLTATYRRSPSFFHLATPLLPGVPLLAAGLLGILGATGSYGLAWPIGDLGYRAVVAVAWTGMFLTIVGLGALAGEVASRVTFRDEQELAVEQEDDVSARATSYHTGALAEGGGAVATLQRPSASALHAAALSTPLKLDARGRSMQATAGRIKPLANFIYWSMAWGVVLITAGTILGGVWADYSWGRFWGWDPKEVWARHAGDLPHPAPRPTRRLDQSLRTCGVFGSMLDVSSDGMVRREFRAGRGTAQLRLHRGRRPGRGRHDLPGAAGAARRRGVATPARLSDLNGRSGVTWRHAFTSRRLDLGPGRREFEGEDAHDAIVARAGVDRRFRRDGAGDRGQSIEIKAQSKPALRAGDFGEQHRRAGGMSDDAVRLPLPHLDARRRQFDEPSQHIGRRPTTPLGMPQALPDLVRSPSNIRRGTGQNRAPTSPIHAPRGRGRAPDGAKVRPEHRRNPANPPPRHPR